MSHACPLTDEAIAFSLRQMTADQEQRFREHIGACAACRLKLAEMDETLNLLPLSVTQVSPPPDLKRRVMARIAASPRRKRRFAVPVWAAAAVAALALGSYSLLRIQSLQDRLSGYEQAAPIERSYSMIGTREAPTATGRVLVAREGGGTRITLHASGLPPLASGQTYHLWLVKDGQRKCGGVFLVDAAGRGGLANWLPDAVEFDALGVTLEPDAQGIQPRGPKVMGSSI